jgi:hypothetical protein
MRRNGEQYFRYAHNTPSNRCAKARADRFPDPPCPLFMAGQSAVGSGDSALCHHRDKRRAIIGSGVHVGHQVGGANLDAVKRLSLERLGKRGLKRLGAEHAIVASTRHRHAHVIALGDEDADDCITRGRVRELFVAGLCRRLELHRCDDLAILQVRSRTDR